jgi:Bacteriocin-protection, YdeI or OmpD-Associated/Domain of unknown function (DUF1905)
MRFRTTLLLAGKTATGFRVPDEVMAGLAAGRKPAVTVTINDYTYRSSVATVDGSPMVGVSAENRAGAGVRAGDEVDVDIELDTSPRVVTVPPDFAEALDHDPVARQTFDALSYSNKNAHVSSIEGAKSPETRSRRIDKAIATLHEGRAR